MDPRIPIAVALGIAYTLWFVVKARKDPAMSRSFLRQYSRYALLAGCAFLVFTLVLHVDDSPASDILAGINQSYRTIGGIALGYSLVAASGIFWFASLRYRD